MPAARACAALLALLLAPIARADLTAVPPPPGVLPDDPGRLAAIRQKHASIVRGAEHRCGSAYGWNGGPSFRACMISGVESAISVSQDPALLAYHRSMPFPIRYQWRNDRPEPWRMR